MTEEALPITKIDEFQVRQAVDRLVVLCKNDRQKFYDEVGTVPGIQIIMRNEDLPPGTDCEMFLFGKELKFITNWPLCGPVEGATAVYGDKRSKQFHVGKVTKNGTVISKLGEMGHVYETPRYFSSSLGEPTYRKIPIPFMQYL